MAVLKTPAERVAAELTPAQGRVVVGLQGDRFVDYAAAGIQQRRTRMRLNQLGITEPQVVGPVTIYANIKLTALGLSVQELLRLRHRQKELAK